MVLGGMGRNAGAPWEEKGALGEEDGGLEDGGGAVPQGATGHSRAAVGVPSGEKPGPLPREAGEQGTRPETEPGTDPSHRTWTSALRGWLERQARGPELSACIARPYSPLFIKKTACLTDCVDWEEPRLAPIGGALLSLFFQSKLEIQEPT